MKTKSGGTKLHGALLWALLCLGYAPLPAATTNSTPADFGALNLAQLAEVDIDIASIRSRPVREQPGIFSVIEASEIRETGARDLADILQLVPGFGLGEDVNGVLGPSFRGLWAYEGKLQLIVDGMEMNETLYGTTQLGHHIPADAIEQVEIIRGPGSAKYGGTAELAVVRVTTKGAAQNGIGAVVQGLERRHMSVLADQHRWRPQEGVRQFFRRLPARCRVVSCGWRR